MNHSKSNPGNRSHNGSGTNKSRFDGVQTKTNTGGPVIHSIQLMKLFENELRDIYWAEKALTKAIPKMIRNASSDELIEALENHLEETEEQVKRIEQVFESIEKKPSAKKCPAMEGLINEAVDIMELCEEGAMCDAGIIAAGQKIEHYEIASYDSLRLFAETLGLNHVVSLLDQTLGEEKAADEKLMEIMFSVLDTPAMGNGSEWEEVEEVVYLRR